MPANNYTKFNVQQTPKRCILVLKKKKPAKNNPKTNNRNCFTIWIIVWKDRTMARIIHNENNDKMFSD